MIPKLYDSFDLTAGASGPVDFLGRISHCKKCQVTEVRNGEYSLELETLDNDPTAGLLLSQRIIGAKANPSDPVQYFEIQETEKTSGGIIKAAAKHVKNFACQLTSAGDMTAVDDPNVFTLTPAGVWQKLFDDEYISDICPFTFASNITATAAFSLGFNDPKTLGDIIGGEEGSIIDTFRGELKYDNYAISFNLHRGTQSSYKLRYGQNIADKRQKEDCYQVYSHIQPFGSVSRTDGKYINIYSNLYEIPNHESKTKKVFVLDCSDAVKDIQVGTAGQHYMDAKDRMTAFAAQYAIANSLGKTNISIEVTARADLDAMQLLGLCDTVKVVLDDQGTTTAAKITSVTYDSLLERWDRMTVGETPLSLADIILNKRRYNL